MKNIKPVGLKGKEQVDRMKQLMGKAPLNETKSNSKVELTKLAPDNKVYGIVRENHEYYIKTSDKINDLTLENFQYIGGLKNKKDFSHSSYANALKQLNLKMISLNEQYEGDKVNVFENDNLFKADIEPEEETIEENFFEEEEVSEFFEKGGVDYGKPDPTADDFPKRDRFSSMNSDKDNTYDGGEFEEELTEFAPERMREPSDSAAAGAAELARLIKQAADAAPGLMQKLYAELEALGAGAGRAMRENKEVKKAPVDPKLKVGKVHNDGPKELKGNAIGSHEDVTDEPDDDVNDKSTGTEKDGAEVATPKKTIKETKKAKISIVDAMKRMDSIVESLDVKKKG